MKILFLTYYGFDEASGITKKIQAQVKAYVKMAMRCIYAPMMSGLMAIVAVLLMGK